MKKIFFLMYAFLFALIFYAEAQVTTINPTHTFKSLSAVIDSYPSISKDGKRIVFQSNRSSGRWEIYSMDNEGNNIKQLTFDSDASTPVWSPDGAHIIYCTEKVGDSEIFIMDASGANQKRLTNQPGDDSHPKFSPDGKFIIFNSARTNPDLSIDWGKQWHEIFIMKIDGSDVRQITSLKTVTTYPSISPDGVKICFRSTTNEASFNWDLTTGKRNSEIFVMNIDGTNLVNVSNNTAYDGWPTWTPYGNILYSSNRGGVLNSAQLYSVNVDGTNTKLVFAMHGVLAQASISSDGKKIYCYHNSESIHYEYGGIGLITIE